MGLKIKTQNREEVRASKLNMTTSRRQLDDQENSEKPKKEVHCVVKMCGVIALIVGVELVLLLLVPVEVRPVPVPDIQEVDHRVTVEHYPALKTEIKVASMNTESSTEPLKTTGSNSAQLKKTGSNSLPLKKTEENSTPLKKTGSSLVPTCISVLCIPWWVYLVCGGVVVCMVVAVTVWVCVGEILLAGWVQTRAARQGYVEII